MYQKGFTHILLLIAGLGLLAFFALVSFAPFRNSLFSSLFPKSSSHAATVTDWPQVQKDPQRTGFTSETLGTNFKIKWSYAFQPEKVFPQVQAIVYDNKVYIGTEMGNMYAFDAVNGDPTNANKGKVIWKKNIGSPILNSVAADNGKVYFGAMDGAVYALNVSDGSQAWKTQLSPDRGFSTAPLFTDSKIMLGGRDGKFYALDPNNGNKLWEYNAGSPILMTAAWDSGKAFFGTMDMVVHAVNTSNGSGAWKSPKIKGLAFKDFWPVVTQGKVLIRPMGGPDWGVKSANSSDAAQTAALAAYDANPAAATPSLNILDANTGALLPAVINWDTQTMDGAPAPPCVDKDNNIIVPIPRKFTNGSWDWRSGWGQVSLSTRKIVDVLLNPGQADADTTGVGNPDENLQVSCTGNMVLGFHLEETNANYTGAYDLTAKKWYLMTPGAKNQQMSTNTQGGGGNPPSVSNGMIYHVAFPHELVARTIN